MTGPVVEDNEENGTGREADVYTHIHTMGFTD